MPDQFFIVSAADSGPRIEGPFSAKQVRERITPDAHGDTYYGPLDGFFEKIPDFQDPNVDISTKLLIIKGSIVVPKALEGSQEMGTVTKNSNAQTLANFVDALNAHGRNSAEVLAFYKMHQHDPELMLLFAKSVGVQQQLLAGG